LSDREEKKDPKEKTKCNRGLKVAVQKKFRPRERKQGLGKKPSEESASTVQSFGQIGGFKSIPREGGRGWGGDRHGISGVDQRENTNLVRGREILIFLSITEFLIENASDCTRSGKLGKKGLGGVKENGKKGGEAHKH